MRNREIETCINYCEPGYAYMSSNEKCWIVRIKKLAEAYPDECIIMKNPEENMGFIYSKFPQKWVRISPPRKISISDEERAKRSQNLHNYRESSNNKEDD